MLAGHRRLTLPSSSCCPLRDQLTLVLNLAVCHAVCRAACIRGCGCDQQDRSCHWWRQSHVGAKNQGKPDSTALVHCATVVTVCGFVCVTRFLKLRPLRSLGTGNTYRAKLMFTLKSHVDVQISCFYCAAVMQTRHYNAVQWLQAPFWLVSAENQWCSKDRGDCQG